MEFQEVCKNFIRMCDSIVCSECGIAKAMKTKNEFSSCESFLIGCPEKSESIIEQWAKENPVATNADKFREVFGKTLGSYGSPCANALTIYEIGVLSNIDWLNQEYKEPEEEG